jgi:hypothetical protein
VVSGLVHAYLQTRGGARAGDYTFLGAAPAEPWWRAYRDATAFDHPTVLVTSDGERWAAYVSGIPSSRTDAVGTVVRYTLVLDGACSAAETDCVVAAVAAWLDDVAAGHGARPGGRLAAALDARFPAVDVEHWLAGRSGRPSSDERHFRRIGSDESAVRQERDTPAGAAVGDDVRQRALAALAALPRPAAAAAADEPGEWIAAVGAPAARSAFVVRVAALVGGMPGRALLLNLVGGLDEAQPLLDPASPVTVLVESSDPQLARYTALRPVVEAKKATAPPARGAGVVAVAGIAVLPLVVLFVLLATTALMVALLFWLL